MGAGPELQQNYNNKVVKLRQQRDEDVQQIEAAHKAAATAAATAAPPQEAAGQLDDIPPVDIDGQQGASAVTAEAGAVDQSTTVESPPIDAAQVGGILSLV